MTIARDPEDQERLIAYVREALQLLDQGLPVAPTVLCAAHPALARPLAEVLGLQAELPLLQQAALREDPLAGLVLGARYRLDACLGRGAMGVVYRGEDLELRRPVAVKILDARLFRDAQAEQRFQREGEALGQLQHPHVVTVYDRGRTPEGIHFLVMELLVGSTLAGLLDQVGGGDPVAAVAERLGGPPAERHWPRLCAAWARDLALGLAAAHDRGLVHRDVKPSNVFVRTDGRPVLLDFGIAARPTDARLTATQTTLGTPWYMAPEQVRAGGLQAALPTLDVYGLGATLYHLLAGRPPYVGDAAAVLAALGQTDPEPLGRVAPTMPRDLQAIVEHCLERDPGRRYPTATALAADLDAFLQHRPVAVRPLSGFARRLRQWRRAPARPLAVALAASTALALAVSLPIHLRQQRAAALVELARLHAALPSVLAVEGWPDERVLADLRGEHTTAIGLLDAILQLDPDDVPVRLWRACLWLDLGDRARAAADLATIASRHGGGYLAQLAGRYRDADPAQQGAFAIDTAGLPAPDTPVECYVAGLHELRARHQAGFAERADSLLARAAEHYLPARDLRLLAVADKTDQPAFAAERPRLLQFLHDETITLETLYGGPTARTLAMRGLASLGQQRFAEAAAAFEASLGLRPERHGPHQNAGIAYLKLGQLDLAEQHLRTALRLRPFAWNTKYTLAQLEQARGDFDAARQWAEQVPTEGHAGQVWKQPNLLGAISTAEAMALLRVDPAGSAAAARRAVAAYDQALRAMPGSAALARRRQLAEALQADNLQASFVAYCRLNEGDPDDPFVLSNLAFLMPPDGLGADETAWLAAILRRLAERRAGGNEALRKRLLQEIEAGLQGRR